MASFTDSVPQFNEYVAQQPIEAMRTVGMVREQQFQQGINKVQSFADSLLGAPIAKDETKKYLEGKLGEMKESIGSSISGDFSNQRLVNNVGGLMGKIAHDPIVENGIRSTARLQSGITQMEQSKKDGKWSQQNEDYFNNSVSSWLSDGSAETSFDDEYRPWVDYTDRFMKLYKEVNKGEDIPGDAFSYNEAGEIVANDVIKSGISPDKIRNVWNIVASQPDVQQQLSIDGWHKYRGLTPQQLSDSVAMSTNDSLKDIESTVRTLQAKLATASAPDGIKLSDEIEQLKQLAIDKKASADRIMRGIERSPEGAKAALVQQDMLSSLIGAYSYETMKKSPLWETSMEEARFKREAEEWQATYDETVRYHNYQMAKDELDRVEKANKEAKEKGIPGDGTIVLDAPVSSTQSGGSAPALADVELAKMDYTQSQRAAVNSIAGAGISPYRQNATSGLYEYNVGPAPDQYKTEEEAGRAAYDLYASANDDYINGSIVDPVIKDKIEQSKNAYNNLLVSQERITKVDRKFGDERKRIEASLGNINEIINYGGGKKTVSTRDMVDVYTIKNKLPGAAQSTARLNTKFGDAQKFISEAVDSPTVSGIDPLSPFANTSGSAVAPLSKIYKNTAQVLSKDKSLSPTLQLIENEYSNLQTAVRDKVVTYPNDEKSRDVNFQTFSALASRLPMVDEGSGKGASNELLEVMRNTDKASKDNIYQSGFNTTTGQGWISVKRGSDAAVRVEVPASVYFDAFPNQRVNRTFAQKFGNKLAVGEGNTAFDSPTEPRATGYQPNLPANFPYTVQYQLKRSGKSTNGDVYDMFWWITPKKTEENPNPKPIISERMNGKVPRFPLEASEAQIVEWSNQLNDKDWLNLYIQSRVAGQTK